MHWSMLQVETRRRRRVTTRLSNSLLPARKRSELERGATHPDVEKLRESKRDQCITTKTHRWHI